MVTAANKSRWFNQQRFPKRKPEDAYRIFCLGGSTTYGHPYDDVTSFAGWLRELLPEVDRSRRWEVINAGGISYASYRVAIVMKELLEYDPDLFIVYSGHNEFLEARTYGRLKKTPQIVLLLDRMCSRTRTYAAVSWLVAGGDHSTERRRLRADKSLLPAEVNTLLDNAIGPAIYHRDDDLRQGIVEHFTFNLRRMVKIGARCWGTPDPGDTGIEPRRTARPSRVSTLRIWRQRTGASGKTPTRALNNSSAPATSPSRLQWSTKRSALTAARGGFVPARSDTAGLG